MEEQQQGSSIMDDKQLYQQVGEIAGKLDIIISNQENNAKRMDKIDTAIKENKDDIEQVKRHQARYAVVVTGLASFFSLVIGYIVKQFIGGK